MTFGLGTLRMKQELLGCCLLYFFTVLASVVPELNILVWHEFYYLAFSFGSTVLSCHYPSQVCRRPRVSSQTRFFFCCSSAKQTGFVSDCLGHCACASSSFVVKAKASWLQVQLRRSASFCAWQVQQMYRSLTSQGSEPYRTWSL